MDDPIKIIFKYKNLNRRNQYHVYIFVGNVKDKSILDILKKIEDFNLFDTLTRLTENEIKIMISNYGDMWYTKFFNSYHIELTFNNILKTNQRKDDIIKKYGEEWFNIHVNLSTIRQRASYSFQYVFQQERKLRERQKREKEQEQENELDYTTNKNVIIDLDQDREGLQIGGDDEMSQDEIPSIEDIDVGTGEPKVITTDPELEEEMQPDDMELADVDEFDLEELESMYKKTDVDLDENIVNTTKLLNEILPGESDYEAKKDGLLVFDQGNDNNMYDENLKNVYKKYYVYHQYLFKDDTIRVIKQKICTSIKNNNIFSTAGNIKHNPYIIPSRQYLWCEYTYKSDKTQKYEKDKVMVGQKWIRKNELLTIDIEPNDNIRIYENLRGSFRNLRDNMKKYGSKIKREDDDYNILYDYQEYMTLNEIYMIDLYNELGLNYNTTSENLKNLYDVYIKIYFPNIASDDFKQLIDYLNVSNTTDEKLRKNEINRMYSVFRNIYNDLLMENEIVNTVEEIRKTPAKFKNIFKENFITQSVIHVNLSYITLVQTKVNGKLDLFRIYDNFIVNNGYPFLQYQSPDSQMVFKFFTNAENIDKQAVLSRWFENEPYGINFKVKINQRGNASNKYISINLNENGRIEYKTQWKEEDMATIEDIYKTYDYVRNLLVKINVENNKVQINLPENSDFKFAFINTIQQFELPEKFVINHNDLSDFSRYFYPYVALVIEPRKRISKLKKFEDEKSKFGTYLRYKRISKYENKAKIEHRVLYFMRNYEFNDKSLATEISKQFNITEKQALETIESVKQKYPNIKKSRKILKKLENIPKYKPPGIGIDIQGKLRNKYKMRISGARYKAQLDRMITFMNILIYLYIDTYLYKNKDRQQLKEKLKLLTNIAKRRNKVEEIVKVEEEIKTIKQMTQLDKERIGFKPEKGHNQWTRSCQNSGTDKKRQPQQYTDQTVDKLVKSGYKFNPQNGEYEKKVKRGKKEYVIKAIKLKSINDQGTIFYTCDPDENKEHMYIGFLSRSNNPHGHCMPCCFKKDPSTSKNREKKDYYLKCIGQLDIQKTSIKKILGDKLYILQDTNKIQEGRFGFLPKHLDIFFNFMLNKTNHIKNHYLISSNSGYFFKYGSRQDNFPFLTALGSAVDLSVDEIKSKFISKLTNDKNELIFTSLNNGDIRTQFKTIDSYIHFINNNEYLDYELFGDFISLPNVITENGCNMLIFEKKTQVINEELEKRKIKEDYVIICMNPENNDNLTDPKRDNIILLKEGRNYYPIFLVIKNDKIAKNIILEKIYKYHENDPKNIIYHILRYYNLNCGQTSIASSTIGLHRDDTAKFIYDLLIKLKNQNFMPKEQIIDTRNKCKYIITKNNTIIPVLPSGSIYNLPIRKDIKTVMSDFDNTAKSLLNIYNISKHEIRTNPNGVYYNAVENNKLKIVAIITNKDRNVPILPTLMTKEQIINFGKKNGIENMHIENTPLFDIIDNEISKGPHNIASDKRIKEVQYNKYETEGYELFRLELSDYLINNEKIKNKLIKIIDEPKMDKEQKRYLIKKILYKITNTELYDLYKKENKQEGGAEKKPPKQFIYIYDKDIDLVNYETKNVRDLCEINKKDSCSNSFHCKWSGNSCKLAVSKELLIKYINKITEELVENDLKANEILRKENYFVSDIVNYDTFTERSGQKIIKSSSVNTQRILSEMFGEDNVPTIGKRRSVKGATLIDENIENPLKLVGDVYIQNIIPNNNTLFRAYSNGYYWINNKLYDVEYRNIGFYSNLQTDLSNYFKSLVLDWLNNNKNQKTLVEELKDYIKTDENYLQSYLLKMIKNSDIPSNYIIELYILSKIYNKPIIIYDNFNNPIYIYDNGLKVDKKLTSAYEKINKQDVINIRFNYYSNNNYPSTIDAMYWI